MSKDNLYTDGYYAQRIEAGDRPDYRLLGSNLPVPLVDEMDIESTFLKALEKYKQYKFTP